MSPRQNMAQGEDVGSFGSEDDHVQNNNQEQDDEEDHGANDEPNIVLLPESNVFLKISPLREMIPHSGVLYNRHFQDICYFVSVPANACTIGHVANYVCTKVGVETDDERPNWTYPIALFIRRAQGEYIPLNKRKSMGQLKEQYPLAFDEEEKALLLFYTHGYELLFENEDNLVSSKAN